MSKVKILQKNVSWECYCFIYYLSQLLMNECEQHFTVVADQGGGNYVPLERK